MKRWIKFASIFAVVLFGIAAVTGLVLAQGPEDGNRPPAVPQDEDGDGVCDVCGAEIGDGFARGWRFNQDGTTPWVGRGRSAEREFIDEDGDGICDQFIDEDGDGVCDICGAESGDEFARGWRFSEDGTAPSVGQGRFAEREFIDEDGDGVCDECGMALQDRSGPMRGGRMGSRMGGRGGGRYNTP